MTPLEVRQHLLPIAKLRGYDRAATDSFLKRVGTDYEAVWAERDGLKKRLAHLESELAASRERETAATQTLIAAEESAAETRAAARERAGTLTSQTEDAARELRQAAELAAQLRKHVADLESELGVYREREAIVAETLIVAETSAAQIRSAAREQASALTTDTEIAARELRQGAEREAQAIVSEAETMMRQLEEEAARARERHEAELERLQRLADETRQSLSSLLIDTLYRAGVDVEHLGTRSAAVPSSAAHLLGRRRRFYDCTRRCRLQTNSHCSCRYPIRMLSPAGSTTRSSWCTWARATSLP